jgi:hypothetical protein
MTDAAIPPARRPEHAPSEPIPIPEAEARSRKARTVRIQDILAAHARALDVRLEEGMRDIRLAMDAAIRRTNIHEAPPLAQPPVMTPVPAPSPAPAPAAPREDVARGLAQQTEERFQALGLRLQRIEDALRGMGRGSAGGEIEAKLDALADGMGRFAEAEERLLDRFLEAQREGLDDLTRRVGAGVSAVIRALQNELTATVQRLELTADASTGASADEAWRLERTMMAIAEHQESVLDERLSEIRQSIDPGARTPAETSENRP